MEYKLTVTRVYIILKLIYGQDSWKEVSKIKFIFASSSFLGPSLLPKILSSIFSTRLSIRVASNEPIKLYATFVFCMDTMSLNIFQ